ncbi:hypothetical protein POP12_044 [Pectobacterium phage POP12]|nr:hypothetical protein POP12_044 [Pectobacterium phage POP12]
MSLHQLDLCIDEWSKKEKLTDKEIENLFTDFIGIKADKKFSDIKFHGQQFQYIRSKSPEIIHNKIIHNVDSVYIPTIMLKSLKLVYPDTIIDGLGLVSDVVDYLEVSRKAAKREQIEKIIHKNESYQKYRIFKVISAFLPVFLGNRSWFNVDYERIMYNANQMIMSALKQIIHEGGTPLHISTDMIYYHSEHAIYFDYAKYHIHEEKQTSIFVTPFGMVSGKMISEGVGTYRLDPKDTRNWEMMYSGDVLEKRIKKFAENTEKRNKKIREYFIDLYTNYC